jgi:hypothetical protein
VTIVYSGIMRLMSETSETPTVQTATATAPPPAAPVEVVHRHPRVFQFAAWVAVVAGIVFIVAVIFFAGFGLGKHSGHGGGFHHGHHQHHAMFMHPHGHGGPGGPGGGGPSAIPQGAPSFVRPSTGPVGPGQIPSSVYPSVTATP